MIREKHHRLAPERYRGNTIVAFTANIKYRVPFFTSVDRFVVFEGMLIRALNQFACQAEIYLFMPEHVHLILRGQTDESDVLRAMGLFKQLSGFWLSCNFPTVRWQRNFYDHVIQGERELQRHVRYVLYNPVKAGFVKHWKDYLLKGSTLHKLDEWDHL